MSDPSLADVLQPVDWSASALSPPPLTGNRIWLWYLDQSQIPLHETWLAPDEVDRTVHMKPERRNEFVSGRNALRAILGYLLDRNPADVAIRISDKGKPYLEGRSIEFSFAHCHKKLLMGFASRPLGIDLEIRKKRDNLPGIARRMFDEGCCEQLVNANDADREILFFRFWSAHEAVQKLRGDGLFGKRHLPSFVGSLSFTGFHGAVASTVQEPVFVMHEELPAVA